MDVNNSRRGAQRTQKKETTDEHRIGRDAQGWIAWQPHYIGELNAFDFHGAFPLFIRGCLPSSPSSAAVLDEGPSRLFRRGL